MDKYIYSKADFENAIEHGLKDFFGYELIECISERAIKELDNYVNYYRFTDRNCPGCVSGPEECDVAYGRNKGRDIFDKAKKGKVFDCPCRINGTMCFSREEGIKEIDISDREESPYPVVKLIEP